MTALPYMPFFVSDYLADTQHLTTREHGAYLLLIMHYWQRQGPLPGDDKRLSAIARMTFAEWQAVKPAVEEFFRLECDGNADAMRWHHARIDHEIKNAISKSVKARASAKSRWEKDKNAVALPTQCGRNAMKVDEIKEYNINLPLFAPDEIKTLQFENDLIDVPTQLPGLIEWASERSDDRRERIRIIRGAIKNQQAQAELIKNSVGKKSTATASPELVRALRK